MDQILSELEAMLAEAQAFPTPHFRNSLPDLFAKQLFSACEPVSITGESSVTDALRAAERIEKNICTHQRIVTLAGCEASAQISSHF